MGTQIYVLGFGNEGGLGDEVICLWLSGFSISFFFSLSFGKRGSFSEWGRWELASTGLWDMMGTKGLRSGGDGIQTWLCGSLLGGGCWDR